MLWSHCSWSNEYWSSKLGSTSECHQGSSHGLANNAVLSSHWVWRVFQVLWRHQRGSFRWVRARKWRGASLLHQFEHFDCQCISENGTWGEIDFSLHVSSVHSCCCSLCGWYRPPPSGRFTNYIWRWTDRASSTSHLWLGPAFTGNWRGLETIKMFRLFPHIYFCSRQGQIETAASASTTAMWGGNCWEGYNQTDSFSYQCLSAWWNCFAYSNAGCDRSYWNVGSLLQTSGDEFDTCSRDVQKRVWLGGSINYSPAAS